jgi:hypothetical protein
MIGEHDPETGEIPTPGHNSGHADPEEQKVDDALHALEQNIDALALAAGNRLYAEQMRKAIKAMVMKKHADKAIGVQEREAYDDPLYLAHLEKQRRWEIEYWKAHGISTYAREVISVYKTRCANRRPSGKL